MTKKGDLTKKIDQVFVWDDWIGCIPESMDNGCWRVGSGEIGHQRSFGVIRKLPIWDYEKSVLGCLQ